jgi:phosphatidylglycerol---prolipoprotein diacylglyceryl transferase
VTYVAAITVAIAVTLALLWQEAQGGDRRHIARLLLLLGIAGALGAKLYSVVERGGAVWHDLEYELRSGYRYPGGILAIGASLPLLWRLQRPAISSGRFLDAVAIGMCAAIAAGRVGCYLAGCCHGAISDLPWATRYPAGTAPWYDHRAAELISETSAWSAYGHPLQLYFLAAIVAIGALLLSLRAGARRAPTSRWLTLWQGAGVRFEGELMLVFLVLDGLSKGALESLRFDYHASLQAFSLATAAIGAVIWMVVRRHISDASCRQGGVQRRCEEERVDF